MMIARSARRPSPISFAALIPPLVIAGAAALLRLPIVLAYPRAAALLFLWIASDSMMLGLIARDQRPGWRAGIAAMAGAGTAVFSLSPPPIFAALVSMPWALAVPVIAIALHGGWGLWRITARVRHWDTRDPDRWAGLLAEIFPKPLARIAMAELRLLHLALFRWGAAPDVPSGTMGFAYHRHLQPMMIALLLVSCVEIGVTHLLIAHWNRTLALILFAISDVSLLYLIGLIKSLRLAPVLLTETGVRIRAGMLVDRVIPYADIAAVQADPDGETVRAPDSWNVALLAWPNMLLRLDPPSPPRSRWRPGPVRAIAFRLDEPGVFLDRLRMRLVTRDVTAES
ncbi:MAG TPA: hypothetical protein QF469_01830 [Sphingomonas sanguinis]|uniref:hypothetical protein n=1 Tax=Sphingomonas sanguinis TaxID=33051 RepID=UPI002ABEF173|nr:hypothetical protein [Sphingomonas sanguinis]